MNLATLRTDSMGVNLINSRLIEDYARSLALRNFAPFSVERYKTFTLRFLVWAWEQKGIERLQDIKKEDLSDFQNVLHLQKRLRDNIPLSAATKAKYILALKSFFRFLTKQQILLYNPASELEAPKQNPDRLRPILKEKEIKLFLDSVKGDTVLEIRDRAIFEVLYSTGIRNSELRSLNVEDVDSKKEELVIRHAKGYFGERQRIVPIGKLALAWVREYLENSRPKLLQDSTLIQTLFVTGWGSPIPISIPGHLTRAYAKRMNLGRRITPHILRHSFAVHLLKRGADIRFVQEMLGHASLDSTKLYTKLEISDLKRIHKRFHPRER